LDEFHLPCEQLNNHAIEILLYKINTIKPLYKDIRIATVKYDLNELSQSDQSRMKKTLNESDPSSIIQVRFIFFFFFSTIDYIFFFLFLIGSRFR